MAFIPPTPQRFNANQQIVDPKTGYAANVFLRFVNGIRDVVAYITTVDEGINNAQNTANTALANAATAQTTADAAQITADGAAPKTLILSASAGLIGGGDLSADRAFAVGQGTGILVNADDVQIDPGYINFGTYTPTTGNLQSVDAVSVTGTAKWERTGNIVTVSVFVNVDPTTSGVLTAFNVSLPIPSNFATVSDCIGNASCGNVQQSGFVIADPVNDAARIVFLATSAGANDMAVSFRYEVLV